MVSIFTSSLADFNLHITTKATDRPRETDIPEL